MLSLRLPTCLSFCVAPLLGPGNQLLGGQESLPYGKDLIAASATKVGEIGNYLQCVRMVNETYDRAGSHSRPGLKAAARAANHACIQASVQAMRPHSTLSCVSFCWDRNTLSDADLMRAFEPTTLRKYTQKANIVNENDFSQAYSILMLCIVTSSLKLVRRLSEPIRSP